MNPVHLSSNSGDLSLQNVPQSLCGDTDAAADMHRLASLIVIVDSHFDASNLQKIRQNQPMFVG